MMPKLLKCVMVCHKPRILSYLVAALHFVLTLRTIYFIALHLICYYTEEDQQTVSKDDIFDMPITVVRYMIIMFVLIIITSVLLVIGIALDRPLCIACFMLTIGVFIVTFAIFAICDVLEGMLEGTAFIDIFLEFMNDVSLLFVDVVLIYPIFLVFVDLTAPLAATSRPRLNRSKTISIANSARGEEV